MPGAYGRRRGLSGIPIPDDGRRRGGIPRGQGHYRPLALLRRGFGKEIHIVLDNGSPHTARHTKTWPAAHPRRHVRWTPPHASWLNQV
ncbi:transposase [Streptomyces sp. NPDC001880]